VNDFNRMMYALHDNDGSASLAQLVGFRDTLATAQEIVNSGLAVLIEDGPSPVLRMTDDCKATMTKGRGELVSMMFDQWESESVA